MKKSIVYVILALLATAAGVAAVYFVKQGKLDIKSLLSFNKEKTEVLSDSQAPLQEEPVINTSVDTLTLPPLPESSESEIPGLPDPEPENVVEDHPDAPVAPPMKVDKSDCRVEQVPGEVFRVTGLRAHNAEPAEIYFVLSDSEGHRYESSDGSFDDVAPNTKGTYAAVVKNRVTNEKSAAVIIGGFKIEKPVERMTAAELTDLFNKGSGDDLDAYKGRFASIKTCKVISNRSDVSTLSRVFMVVNMEELKATVNNVEYDAAGRIISVNVSLN